MLLAIGHILAILATVTFLICSHELGHLWLARLAGIKVVRFSIGFGKPLFSIKTAKGTEIVLAAIPLGGYVKLFDEREKEVLPEDLNKAFNRKSIVSRIAVIIAGPMANFLVAAVAFWLAFSIGVSQIKPIIGSITSNSIAAHASVAPNSTITKINNQPVYSWLDVSIAVMQQLGNGGTMMLLTRQENSEHINQLDISQWKLDPLQPDPIRSLGINPKLPEPNPDSAVRKQYLINLHYPITQAWIPALQNTLNFIKFNFIITYKMLTGIISLKSLGGPLTLFENMDFAVKLDFANYLASLAILSITIGFINLLPIPALDGGQLLFLIIEAVRGKPLSIAMQVLIFRLGVIVLAMLMVQALTNDLLRLAQ